MWVPRGRAAWAWAGGSWPELERHALGAGRLEMIRLETNRVARGGQQLYRSAGYVEVAAVQRRAYAHYWFANVAARSAAVE